MYLKKLELSGFKSFAKKTTLEFPSRITAVVGPNGSGKSNIVEALRWVMGEQSMKSLRGKKGEDLIWNGSPVSPSGGPGISRMGKASVTLFFDNKDGEIPVDFEEVSIARKIFRDGVNEYFINGSHVRLKDITELAARLGLGESKHNIIGQGEVDRILLSSPRERRQMIEEALGLLVYELKKQETEKKLKETEQNKSQAEVLVREITPHLKFLKAQVEKQEMRARLENERTLLEMQYLAAERYELEEMKAAIANRVEPVDRRQRDIRKEIILFEKERAELEAHIRREADMRRGMRQEVTLEDRRRACERELGRLEGKREAAAVAAAAEVPRVWMVDTEYIKEEVKEILQEMRAVLEGKERIDGIRAQLLSLVEDIEKFLEDVGRGPSSKSDKQEPHESDEVRALTLDMEALGREIKKIGEELGAYHEVRKKREDAERGALSRIKEIDRLLKQKTEEERETALERERIAFEEREFRARQEAYERARANCNGTEEETAHSEREGHESLSSAEIKRKIERISIRLEGTTGADEQTLKEYHTLHSRHEFLKKELDDMSRASQSLRALVRELDSHIREDFKEGFAKIKSAFHEYFQIIFGGGKATLKITNYKPRNTTSATAFGGRNEVAEVDIRGKSQMTNAEEGGTDVEAENGVEIEVSLPRKRIHGLQMLSGGERALTSVALLFAFISVRPPPFLVLDETDTALDEANTGRFSALLKELSRKTQLVVVTHNRETMKCAQVLYGVTMGEDGVSKFLSLKFDEAEAYAGR
ncbi:MAG: Chromosome segregation protein SMC [Parcubacteria group bacterium Gr01-1014_33]|nr:MAG: Chromosome segregation protein SMC [Parcubacteria group bacterium Gr01-1014_33]